MKPIKNLESISKWIMRFSIAAYMICLHFDQIKTFDFKNLEYIVNLLFTLSALFLLIGGISKNNTLTIICGLLISVISIYKIYVAFSFSFVHPAGYLYLLILAVGLFFASKGNS